MLYSQDRIGYRYRDKLQSHPTWIKLTSILLRKTLCQHKIPGQAKLIPRPRLGL
jgi:hypothetical protein